MSVEATVRTIEVLDPTAVPQPKVVSLAPRLASLQGIRLGLLDNSKPNADRLLDRVEERLLEQGQVASIRRWRKHSSTVGALCLDELPGEVDAVINAFGD